MKKIGLVPVVLLILLVALYLVWHPFLYDGRYFAELGLSDGRRYHDVMHNMGEPLHVEAHENRYYVDYDGLVFVYDNLEKGAVESVRITGEQYRFGYWRIGVGTPRRKVESVYRHVKKILDLGENEFGVIEGETWIWFEFDKDHFVSKITLSNGL